MFFQKAPVNLTLIRTFSCLAYMLGITISPHVYAQENSVPEPPASTLHILKESIDSFNLSLKKGLPFNDALYKELVNLDKEKWAGHAYSLTKDNTLAGEWIIQTPNVWGERAETINPGRGMFVVERIRKLISTAEHFVDITTLHQFPDGSFKEGIVEGLRTIARSGRKVKVRILAGLYPTASPMLFPQKKYLNSLIKELKSIGNSHLEIYVASQHEPIKDFLSWNHSKIIAVDGKQLIVGGQNLWDKDYLGPTPVHDLNIQISGTSAFYAHKFADAIWKKACSPHLQPFTKPAFWKSGMESTENRCLSNSIDSAPRGSGNTSVLGVGRLANPISKSNSADAAIELALNASQSTLRIAQQDLLFFSASWSPAMTAVGKALSQRQNVYIVLSGDTPEAAEKNSYSTGTIEKTARAIAKYTKQQLQEAMSIEELNNLLCSNLHIAPLRFGPSEAWPSGYDFANHSKFFAIDDRSFYVGSENLYAMNNLIEYGVFIDDKSAVNSMLNTYWNPLWNYSKAAAISGSELKSKNDCVFRK